MVDNNEFIRSIKWKANFPLLEKVNVFRRSRNITQFYLFEEKFTSLYTEVSNLVTKTKFSKFRAYIAKKKFDVSDLYKS